MALDLGRLHPRDVVLHGSERRVTSSDDGMESHDDDNEDDGDGDGDGGGDGEGGGGGETEKHGILRLVEMIDASGSTLSQGKRGQ